MQLHDEQVSAQVTNLRWVQVCGDNLVVSAGFGIGFAGEEQRIVVDDARERLEALVNGQSHGRSRHLTNDLSRKRRRQQSEEQTDQWMTTGGQRNTPHHAVDHQSLDDGAETPH